MIAVATARAAGPMTFAAAAAPRPANFTSAVTKTSRETSVSAEAAVSRKVILPGAFACGGS